MKSYLVLLTTALLIGIYGCGRQRVCFNTVCVNVEVAAAADIRQKGLMFRQRLPQDSGMLFIMPKLDHYPFWMKNMLIPLDIIWLDDDKRIVSIYPQAQPCVQKCPSLYPGVKAKYVVEVNAGFTEKYGIKKGDFVNITP